MSWKRDRPRIFEKVKLWNDGRHLVIPIYYQCRYQVGAHAEDEHFYAELDGRRVTGKLPSEVRALIPTLLAKSYTYTDWAFYLELEDIGDHKGVYNDTHNSYSDGQSLDVNHQLLLLGKRSDGKRMRAPCHFGPNLTPHVGACTSRAVHRWHSELGKTACCKDSITDPSLVDVTKIDEFSFRDRSVVPFTLERLQWLLQLETRIGHLRDRIQEVMHGTGRPLEKRLDAAIAAHEGLLLLPARRK